MMRQEKLTSAARVIALLEQMRSEENRAGMARYGINVTSALGIRVTDLRRLARRVAGSTELAIRLWHTGVHEARILATMTADPETITRDRLDRWAADCDSWDLVDQMCNNLVRKTPFAHGLAAAWSVRSGEFVKRAGFSLMAVLAVHDRKADDDVFRGYLARVAAAAGDDRPYVRKAVSWALRQIGKRNRNLWYDARETAVRIRDQGSRSARWIARDALKELDKLEEERRGD